MTTNLPVPVSAPKPPTPRGKIAAAPVPSAAAGIPGLAPEDVAAFEAALAPLRDKQKAFVRAYLTNGRNASAAARQAGYGGAQPGNLKHIAHRLIHRPDVAAAIEAVSALLTKGMAYDFARASQTLLEGLKFAQDTGNATAFIRGAELMAKLHGHLSDKMDLRAQGNVTFVFPERRREVDE